LAGSTTKKAVIRRLERDPLVGFVNPISYLRPTGVELLTLSGALILVPYEEVKWVAFVREFPPPNAPPDRKVFNTRPKMGGLWVRMTFQDGDVMEGILPNNLLQLEPQGFTVIPPDPYSGNQRLFLPKAALVDVQVLGVVGSPLRRPKPKPVPKEQIGLFE
jgi:hypothetical protein